jgi:uncharacterized damage-inducible protein DinB
VPEIAGPLVAEFLRYNAWANRELLVACEKLSREQLDSRAEGTYGTIYETIVHLVRAEAAYLHRLTGELRPPTFRWDDSPGLPDIRGYAGQLGDALTEAARRVQPTDVVSHEWQGQPVSYKAIVLLIQAVNHGVEHRTNITTILSQLGVEAPGVDGWNYLLRNRERLGR